MIPALLLAIAAGSGLFLLIAAAVRRRGRRHERTRSAEAADLRSKEGRLRLLLEQLPAVLWTTDRELRFTSSAGAALSSLGLARDQVVGQSIGEYFETDDPEFGPLSAHGRALAGESVSFDQEWRGRVFRAYVEPLRGEHGQIEGTAGVALDVTARRKAEDALGASEARYRTFVRETSEAIWRWEFDVPLAVDDDEETQVAAFYRHLRLAECNDAAARLFGGCDAAELVGSGLAELFPPQGANVERLLAFIRGGYRLVENESPCRDAKGRERYLLNTLVGIREQGRLVQVWGAHRDVTERRHSAEALRRSEEKYRSLFEDSRDPIFISTPDGRLLDINPAGVELFGYESREELLTKSIPRDLYWDPESRPGNLERLAHEDFVRDQELVLKRRDGSPVVALETTTAVRDAEGNVVAFRGMLRDVTTQRQLESQLQRALRMEAVGRLAGGVAHDFNNVLTVINGRCDLVLARLTDERVAAEVREIKEAGSRAALLTRQLLSLSLRQAYNPRLLNLNFLVGELLKLLSRTIPESVEIRSRLAEGLWAVRADPSQMEQILLNMMLNARDAMGQGGRLSLITRNVEVGAAPSRALAMLSAGPWVLLAVGDTGSGMDEKVRARIFEPFFTTKEPGRGAGLGLATVEAIVHRSGGHIRVASLPGRGTCIMVYLPRAVEQGRPASAEGLDVPLPRGQERVILVEDEEPLRDMLKQVLEVGGYRVAAAAGGESALAAAASLDGVDLLVTGLAVGDLAGGDLVLELGARHPGLGVLFISGNTHDGTPGGLGDQLQEGAEILHKPFTPREFALRVRDVLDRRAQTVIR